MSNILTERIIMDRSNIGTIIKSAKPTGSQAREEITTDIFEYLKNDSLSKEEISDAINVYYDKQKLNFFLRILDRIFNDSGRVIARDALITIDILTTINSASSGISKNNKDIAFEIIKKNHPIDHAIETPCQFTSHLITNLYNLCLDRTNFHDAFQFSTIRLETDPSSKLNISVYSDMKINIPEYPLKTDKLKFEDHDILNNPFATTATNKYFMSLKEELQNKYNNYLLKAQEEVSLINESGETDINLTDTRNKFKKILNDTFLSQKIDWENDDNIKKKLPDAIQGLLENHDIKTMLDIQKNVDGRQPIFYTYYKNMEENRSDLVNQHKYALDQLALLQGAVNEHPLYSSLLTLKENGDLLTTFEEQLKLLDNEEGKNKLQNKIDQSNSAPLNNYTAIIDTLKLAQGTAVTLRKFIADSAEQVESGAKIIKEFHADVNNIGEKQNAQLVKVGKIKTALGEFDLSELTEGRPLSNIPPKQVMALKTFRNLDPENSLTNMSVDDALAIKKNCIDYILSFIQYAREVNDFSGLKESPEENLNLIKNSAVTIHNNIIMALTELYKYANPELDFNNDEFSKLFNKHRKTARIIEQSLHDYETTNKALRDLKTLNEPLRILSPHDLDELAFKDMPAKESYKYIDNIVNVYLSTLGVSPLRDLILNTVYTIPRSTYEFPEPENFAGGIIDKKE